MQERNSDPSRDAGALQPNIPGTVRIPRLSNPVETVKKKQDANFYIIILLIISTLGVLAILLYRAKKSNTSVQSRDPDPSHFHQETVIKVEPNMNQLNNQYPVFDIQPMQLIFRRSQTDKASPAYTLHSILDLPDGVRSAAEHYGVFKEIVYIDPKLENARAIRALQASYQLARSEARHKDVMAGNISSQSLEEVGVNLFFNVIKWTFFLPVYIPYRIYKFITEERKQTIRFSQLIEGKSLTSKNLAEIIEAENQIKENMTGIANFIATASHYTGEEILIIPEEKN